MKKIQPSVFEVYAHEYDLITNAAQRESYHAKEVAAIVERFKPSRVLDAGCATGLTTLLFAKQGVAAVGLDRSRRILEVARKNRRLEGLPISYQLGSFEKLPRSMHGRFDLVVCLANSISGAGSMTNLRASLRNFFAVLRPGGHLVLQMLNFAAVTQNTLLPIRATQNGGVVYERFSERTGNKLSVYVTRADFGEVPPKFEIFRHIFDNFSPEQVRASVKKAGFGEIHQFGDLLFSRRFGARSRDLIITAKHLA